MNKNEIIITACNFVVFFSTKNYKMLYQLAKQKQFIIDCQEAGLLTKQIAERKLEQIKLYEETLVKHIMDQNSNKKEPDNMNMVNNIMNESNDLDIVSNVLDNTN